MVSFCRFYTLNYFTLVAVVLFAVYDVVESGGGGVSCDGACVAGEGTSTEAEKVSEEEHEDE